MKHLIFLGLMLFSSAAAAQAQVAQGGTFQLDQTIIAGGGGASSDAVNNAYNLSGTIGQPAAGTVASGGVFVVKNGFWTPDPLGTTAAAVIVGGRVLNDRDTGIANVIVTLIGGSLTAPRVTRTNSFGNFQFSEIESGQFYIVTVQSKKYGFAQNTQAFSLTADLTELVFRADWRK